MTYHRKCQKGFGRDYRPLSRLAVVGALLTALTAGFGLAALLALHAGWGWTVGDWWTPAIQAHGHAQLTGWLGLFIVGVSLFFVPRLAGVPIRVRRPIGWAVGLLLSGVLLRGIGQPLQAIYPETVPPWTVALAALLELSGIALYLFLLLSTVLKASPDRAALMSIRPYLVSVVTGWVGFGLLSLDLSVDAWANSTATHDIAWTRLTADFYLGATLIPICLAFSIRTFPLYLRLSAARWGVQRLGIAYVIVFAVLWAAEAAATARIWDDARFVSGLAHVARGGLLLLFVRNLDLLLRLRPPWTADQIAQPSTGARPTRPGLPDHGEFGRFERLLYLAYGWLVAGALMEMVLGGARLAGGPDPIDADALRHVFLAGFVSSLLLGMAPRMVPGFVHERQVAWPGLVNVTFWLWFVALLGRILPLLIGPVLPVTASASAALGTAFALSGIVGWTAIFVLAVNLTATLRNAATNREESPMDAEPEAAASGV